MEAAGLEFIPIPSGKLRRELSLENIADAITEYLAVVNDLSRGKMVRQVEVAA